VPRARPHPGTAGAPGQGLARGPVGRRRGRGGAGHAGKDHAEQARQALHAGKHVLVEKPLALNAADAQSVVALADARHLTLMEGHLMLYHPAVAYLKTMISAGDLGRIFYIYSLRVNLGRVRQDENALWSLAPHDVSMIGHLLDDEPESVSARGVPICSTTSRTWCS